MSFHTASVTGTCERTLNTGIGAVRLVVSNLTAVEALAGQSATFGLVGTVAGKVTSLLASIAEVSLGACGWLLGHAIG